MTRLYTSEELPEPNKTPRKMPQPSEVFNYWYDSDKFEELDISVFDALHCMACGFYHKHRKRLDRAHIISREHGGSDDVSNLHLLCRNCHIESETLSEEYYWIWFKKKNSTANLFNGFDEQVFLGRDLKEFFKLIDEENYFEAAKWLIAIGAYPTENLAKNMAKILERDHKKHR